MQRVHDIDKRLTALFAGFDQVAHSLTFESLGDLLAVDRDRIQIPGLYFIEVCTRDHKAQTIESWLSQFTAAWDQEEFKKSFVPSCQKARMKKHTVLNEWMPLYLGKAEKIGRRIWEHLYLDKDKRTFALKLQARNLLDGNRFRLSVLRLPLANYDILAPRLESALRRKHHPLVGRQ